MTLQRTARRRLGSFPTLGLRPLGRATLSEPPFLLWKRIPQGPALQRGCGRLNVEARFKGQVSPRVLALGTLGGCRGGLRAAHH